MKSMQSMQVAAALVLGGAAVFHGASVLARPGGSGPCNERVLHNHDNINNGSSCGTWKDCPSGDYCVQPGGLLDCGDPAYLDAYCANYQGGTFDPLTGKCVADGTTVFLGYDTTSYGNFAFYPSPKLCP